MRKGSQLARRGGQRREREVSNARGWSIARGEVEVSKQDGEKSKYAEGAVIMPSRAKEPESHCARRSQRVIAREGAREPLRAKAAAA